MGNSVSNNSKGASVFTQQRAAVSTHRFGQSVADINFILSSANLQFVTMKHKIYTINRRFLATN